MNRRTGPLEAVASPSPHPATDPTTTAPAVDGIEGLLDAQRLLQAINGSRVEAGSPLSEWARELADLHATLLTGAVSTARRPADFDERVLRDDVAETIARIDGWAIFRLPRPVNVPRHTHSLGATISHFARVYAHTSWADRHTTSAEHRREAALHMAQTYQGYADLVTAIEARRILLPLGWRGIGAPR
ncbi:hypothetical protein [Nocardia takedensis]|uniref:hypothetical protein n=1 Tax=Nocardia takedensis TaxID=259390 RepID=UPI0012F63A38|nr:hypothetical protein [Nocardia takedensis]